MTKFLTASRRRCSSAAFTRTRHETMMTTNLTVVELYNVVDRQSPRTQSADTQPLLLDCSRRPSSDVDQHKSSLNSAKLRPPTTVTQLSVPQNTAQHRPQQLGQTSRLFSTTKQSFSCRTLTSAIVLPQPNSNY